MKSSLTHSSAHLFCTCLSTLLSRLGQQVPILTYEHEEDEIMHGIGVRSSSHNMGSGSSSSTDSGSGGVAAVFAAVEEEEEKEIVFEGDCVGANTNAKKQREVSVRSFNSN